MNDLFQELQNNEVGNILRDEPLANHTTMKIGGPADILVEPTNIDELVKLMALLKKKGIEWRAIGRGSNLLVHDEGIRGVVVKLGNNIDHLDVDGETITVGGGYSLIKLATIISKKGLAGLEFAGGIPGSVGGAVYMNAGAHGSDISKVLQKARIVFDDGNVEWVINENMHFSYRTSILQNERPGICVEAIFKLQVGDRNEIVSKMQRYKDYRRETQPWNFPCAGSIFRNPLPEHAGQLIEQAGLKGFSIGGAQISEMHGNFIVNKGNATAEDVLQLIKHAKKTILEKFQIEMETEVEIIGGS